MSTPTKKPEHAPPQPAPAPAAAAANVSSEPPPVPKGRPTWREVWQVPALVASLALLAGGVGVAVALRPKPDFAGMFARADAIITEEKYDEALDYLNAKIFPYVDKAGMSTEQRARFHVLVARSIYLWQQKSPSKQEENFQNVVGEYLEAQRRGAALEPADASNLADSYLSLGNLDQAAEQIKHVGDAQPALRYTLLRKMIEKSMAAGKPEEARTADLLGSLLAEADLPRDVRTWATARQAESMLNAGAPEEAIARLLRLMPRLSVGNGAPQPGLGELYLYLGEGYLRTGATAEARKQLARAAELQDPAEPSAGRTMYLLGRLAESDKGTEDGGRNLEDAREKFETVLSRFGGLPIATSALLGLSEVEAARGEIDRSVSLFTTLVQEVVAGARGPDATPESVGAALMTQFADRFGAADYPNALRFGGLAESVFGPDKAPTPVLHSLGDVHLKLAEDALGPGPAPGDAGARGPGPDAAAMALAQRHFVASGTYYRAYADRLVLTPGQEYADALWAAADAFDRAGDRQSAITAFEEFRAGFPGDVRQSESVFRLAKAFVARGDFPQAITLYNQLIEARGAQGAGRFSDDAYVPLAQTYLLDNDESNDEKAEALLNVVVSGGLGGPQTDNFRDAIALLGEYYYDRARAAQTRPPATGSQPEAAPIPTARDAGTLYAMAITRLDEALSRFPDHPRASAVRYKLADACRLSAAVIESQLAEGMPDAEKRDLTALRPQRLQRAAALFEELRRALEAKDQRRRTAIEELYLRNSYFYLGDCAFNLGDYEAAIRAYDAARGRYTGDPATLVAMVQIVNANLALGDPKRAAAANEQARRFYASLPENVWNDPNLPMTRRDWERWLDASADLSRLAQAAPAPAPGPGQ